MDLIDILHPEYLFSVTHRTCPVLWRMLRFDDHITLFDEQPVFLPKVWKQRERGITPSQDMVGKSGWFFFRQTLIGLATGRRKGSPYGSVDFRTPYTAPDAWTCRHRACSANIAIIGTSQQRHSYLPLELLTPL